jgi:ribokinase
VPSVELHIGGGAANYAFSISKLGLKARVLGLIGKDTFGDYISEKLKEHGVEDALKRSKDDDTGITLGIQFEDGSRSLVTYRGTNAKLSYKDFKLKDIKGKALHIAGYNFMDSLRKDIHKVAKYAKGKGMLVSLDPDIKSGMRFNKKDLNKTLRYVDVFLPDIIEGEMLTGKRGKYGVMKGLKRLSPEAIILKCGDGGCLVSDSSKVLRIKGIKVKAVNTTGAGDMFNAAFIFKYLKSRDAHDSARFANAAAALSVTKRGEDRFVKEGQVNRFLKKV